MRGSAGVEEPVAGAGRRLGRDAGGLEGRVERGLIPSGSACGRSVWCRGRRGHGERVVSHHGLLRVERWPRSEHAGARGAEGHGPGMHKPSPRMDASAPDVGRARALRGAVAGSGAAAAATLLRLAFETVAGSTAISRERGTALTGSGAVSGGGAMSSGESLSRHSLLVVLQLNFFKKKIRASTHKRVRRELGGDHRLDVAVRRVQPAEEIEDLARLGDGVTDVAKRVGELLEASAVLADRHVALMKGTELSFDVDRALEFVVTKETFDVVPDEVRRGTRLVDDVEHILGDGVVDPVHDAVVEHVPLGVAVI